MNNTARDFALQLGALASLYLSLSFLLVLLFGIINISFPDATDYSWQLNSAQDSVRVGIAVLVVFFPTYLTLTRIVNKSRRKSTDSTYLGLTKWLIYLSLLVGGGVLLGDLVAVIMAYLTGEITIRFILKAAAVLLVVGSAFYYYLQDARGAWIIKEKHSILYGVVAAMVVLVAVVFGAFSVDSPAEVREQELDQRQLRDLQEMQSRIIDHVYTSGTAPESITMLYTGITPPEAPAERPAYEYNRTENGFELCARFAQASIRDEYSYMEPAPIRDRAIATEPFIDNAYNWDHSAGRFCFIREIVNAQ